jgi:hypothetical protein
MGRQNRRPHLYLHLSTFLIYALVVWSLEISIGTTRGP